MPYPHDVCPPMLINIVRRANWRSTSASSLPVCDIQECSLNCNYLVSNFNNTRRLAYLSKRTNKFTFCKVSAGPKIFTISLHGRLKLTEVTRTAGLVLVSIVSFITLFVSTNCKKNAWFLEILEMENLGQYANFSTVFGGFLVWYF